jgi:hypothetical protein
VGCTCDDAASKIDVLNTLITTNLLPEITALKNRVTELESRVAELEKPVTLRLDATGAIRQAFGL